MKVSIVMSAMKSDRGVHTNMDAHFDLREDLTGLGFEPVPALSKYKGEVELSYIVPCKLSDLQKFTNLAYEYEQECIMVVNQGDLTCRFVGTSTKITKDFATIPVAGKWTKVSLEDLDNEDSFTKVGETFYQIK